MRCELGEAEGEAVKPVENGICLDVDEHGKEVYRCPNCAATSDAKGRKRFERRHPLLCKKQQAFTKAIAAGVKCVEDN